MGLTRRSNSLTIRYDIEGMPPIERISHYNNAPTSFMPEGMEIRLSCIRTQEWTFSGTEISGSKLRKDGTVGLVGVSRSFYRLTGNDHQGGSSLPGWARELIEFHLAELNAGRIG